MGRYFQKALDSQSSRRHLFSLSLSFMFLDDSTASAAFALLKAKEYLWCFVKLSVSVKCLLSDGVELCEKNALLEKISVYCTLVTRNAINMIPVYWTFIHFFFFKVCMGFFFCHIWYMRVFLAHIVRIWSSYSKEKTARYYSEAQTEQILIFLHDLKNIYIYG